MHWSKVSSGCTWGLIQFSVVIIPQVYIPPIDKDELLKEMRSFLTLETPGDDFTTVMPALAKVGYLRQLFSVMTGNIMDPIIC